MGSGIEEEELGTVSVDPKDTNDEVITLDTMKVLTSMTMLAATTDIKVTILVARIMLRMM